MCTLIHTHLHRCTPSPTVLTFSRGRILRQNPDKSLKSFPPCYTQTPIKLCLEVTTYSNSLNLFMFLNFSYCNVHCKKLRNSYRNLKSENTQDYAPKRQPNCTFMNSASGCSVLLSTGCSVLSTTSSDALQMLLNMS